MEITIKEYCKANGKSIRYTQKCITAKKLHLIKGLLSVRSIGGVYLLKFKGK